MKLSFLTAQPSGNALGTWEWIKLLWWYPVLIAVSLALSLGFGPVFTRVLTVTAGNSHARELGLLFLYWLASYLVPLWFLAAAIVKAFRPHLSRAQRFATILCSYAALILVFTGIYYSMAEFGDNADAFKQYYAYRTQGQLLERGLTQEVRPLVTTERAFRGMESRLWTGLDSRVVRGHSASPLSEPTGNEMAQTALAYSAGEVIHRDSEACISVFLDCFHFSVMTTTTVGYGDITPAKRYSKLAADLQSLSSLALLVFALGMLFSNWWPEALTHTQNKP